MSTSDGNVKPLSYTPIPTDFTTLTPERTPRPKKPKLQSSPSSGIASTLSSFLVKEKGDIKERQRQPSIASTASSESTASSWGDYEFRCSPICICISISVIVIILLLSAALVYVELNPKEHDDSWEDHGAGEDGADFEKEMSIYLDPTVRPCDDFYAYACNGWIARHPVPAHQDIMSAFTTAGMQVERVTYNSLLRKPSEGGKKYKSDTAKSVIAARAVFGECMDKKTRDAVGLKPLVDKLGEMLDKKYTWPILDVPPGSAAATPLKPAELMDAFVRFRGFMSIIDFAMMEDPKEPKKNLIHFLPPDLAIAEKEYGNIREYKDTIKAYGAFIIDAMTMFITFNGRQKDLKKAKRAANNLMAFEAKIALAKTPNEELRESEDWYNKYTMDAYSKIFMNGQFNWTTFFNRFTEHVKMPYPFTPNEEIIILDIGYYNRLNAILSTTPAATFLNYMGWTFVRKAVSYGPSALYAAAFRFIMASTGIENASPDDKQCMSVIEAHFSSVLSRLYIDEAVPGDTKEKAEKMIDQLLEAFKVILDTEATWMDGPTKAKAKEKLAALRRYVAYPINLLDNDQLDEEMGFNLGTGFEVVKGQYFKTFIDLKDLADAKFWLGTKKELGAEIEWMMTPIDVNAAYGAMHNGIFLPAGILIHPFFNVSRPAYLNLAAVGTVIGHELTHGFDDQGREFDSAGRLEPWWSDSTNENFEKASMCFQKQYGTIKDSQTGKMISGLNTLSENIADNGGLRCAYFAFQRLSETGKLPQTLYGNFTHQQLFFLSYAQMWCNNRRIESRREQVDYDSHAPEQYRVNVPLGNFESFANAFKCPIGSPMNRKDKCILW